jgi:multiple sugar transport system permease protein
MSRNARDSRSKRDAIEGYLFIAPWLVGFFGITLIPMLATFFLSFTSYDLMSPPQWIGLGNFRTMFTEDNRYWNSVKATFYFAFVSVPLKLAFALAVAMMLKARRRMIEFYRAVFYAPSIVGGSVAVAVMWREIFGGKGLVNSLLQAFGIPVTVEWLGDPRTAIWTLILLAVWQFGSPMLIFLAGLKQIPPELYESASIDGARRPRQFLSITLPMLSPIIFFNLILQIIAGFTAFTQAFILTNGTGAPLDTTNLYALYLYLKAFRSLEMGFGSGMAWVLLAFIALATALVFKSSPYWVHYETKEGR